MFRTSDRSPISTWRSRSFRHDLDISGHVYISLIPLRPDIERQVGLTINIYKRASERFTIRGRKVMHSELWGCTTAVGSFLRSDYQTRGGCGLFGEYIDRLLPSMSCSFLFFSFLIIAFPFFPAKHVWGFDTSDHRLPLHDLDLSGQIDSWSGVICSSCCRMGAVCISCMIYGMFLALDLCYANPPQPLKTRG